MAQRPNILLIMCDQLRHDFAGYVGCRFAQTPTLDRLAHQGTIFKNCIANSPACTPARIGLATGMMPHRLGALTNDCYLRFSTPTYYQQLRDHGYYVGCVGKLDLAKPELDCGIRGNLPRTFSWGFTHPVECMDRMDTLEREKLKGAFVPADPYTHWLENRGLLETFHRDMLDCQEDDRYDRGLHDTYLPTEAWEDTFIANRAAQWIEEIPTERPWHLFVSFVGPRDPFNAPHEFAEMFRDAEVGKPIPGPGTDKPARIRAKSTRRRPSSDTVTRARRQYSACITAIDRGVARLIDALKRSGVLENTVLLFTADHGEMLYDHGLCGNSVAYESSIRVPLFISGAGVCRGMVSDTMVELIDVSQTIRDIADVPRRSDVDAMSFLPVARGKAHSHRRDTVSSLRSWNALRTNHYKFIDNLNDTAELYDLKEDPAEQKNIYKERQDAAKELRLRLRDRMMSGGCNR
ncbi:MAG: sulfatase-like hydrolase/transferase [Chitinivibrionales bacterium]|nr:sulfatase-like hydrolase/transferase [Chitinivibrionales bacterium]MBD3355844.1 sulfatase-like hydrolase/transferase [Chitinivibrionales bacterium]